MGELHARGSCRPARAAPCRRRCSPARRRAAGRSRARRRTAPSRGRSRAARRRRPTRSRRSSACRAGPPRTCWSAPSRPPRGSRAGTKFSEAIISSVLLLALELALEHVRDLGIDRRQRLVEVAGVEVRQVASFTGSAAGRAPRSRFARSGRRAADGGRPRTRADRNASMIARASSRSACARRAASTFDVVVAARHLGLLGVVRVHARARPWNLLATMLTPVPEPHASTARSARPSTPGRPPPRRARGSRPTRSESVPQSTTSWPASSSSGHDRALQRVARVVESGGDSHGRDYRDSVFG